MKKSFWKEHATSSCIDATDEDIHDEASQGIESLTMGKHRWSQKNYIVR